MKQSKFWLVITIITILSLAYAGYAHGAVDSTKITKEVVYNDAKHLIETGDARVSGALSSLGKSLKVGADQVWIVLVKQQKVWSIGFLLLTLSALANWYVFYKRNYVDLTKGNFYTTMKNGYKMKLNPNYSRNSYSSSEDKYIKEEEFSQEVRVPVSDTKSPWFNYIHLGICIILSIFSYVHFSDILTGFINPEFGAMKTIAQIAQNLK